MPIDALSQVLGSLRLESAVYLEAEFTAPWCVRARHGLSRIRDRLGDAKDVVFFHFFLEGGCRIPGGPAHPPIDVGTGDVVLFSGDREQIMGSDLRMAPVDAESLWSGDVTEAGALRHGGGGATTRVICGYVAYDRIASGPLFVGLPAVVRVPIGEGPRGGVLADLLRMAVRESVNATPGAASVLAKLSELVFVEALRLYSESMPRGNRGWLAGLRDLQVGRALALLHAEPAKEWTVEALAGAVALSRSAFAERFTALVGESPMRYLARWRLALAARALQSGGETLVRIAERAGYESEASFSRAFKREFGLPPGLWRRGPVARAGSAA